MNKQKKPSKADLLIYNALVKAIQEDKLRIYIDSGKLNRPNSPVYDPWETLLPILLPVMVGLALIFSVGVFFGLAFIIGMILIYSFYFKRKLHKRLIIQTKKYLTTNYSNCNNLWNFGGLVLVNMANKKYGCVAPDGDWKEFIVKNYADMMVKEKTDEEKINEEESTSTIA